MKKVAFLLTLQLLLLCNAKAQVFDVDTLQYKGDADRFINFVVMGDGYTATQQEKFILDATAMMNHLFSQPPLVNYVNYFNVFAIKVISADSGAVHPGTASDCSSASPQVPVANPNTYFQCSFDNGVHRAIYPANISGVANVLATNIPNYDQVFLIANTPYYGGAGGAYATTTAHTSSPEINAHELGHSFAYLADEYYAGDAYAEERANMTQITDSDAVAWSNWMSESEIGIHQHCCGGQSASWYRPHNNCKMRYLGKPFCSVCSEAIIETIHYLVGTILEYRPVTLSITSPDSLIDFQLTSLMLPEPNTLQITWKLDGVTVLADVDSIQLNVDSLTAGVHSLTAIVVDTTALLRVHNHSEIHFSEVTWTIHKAVSGIYLTSEENKLSFSLYPNPADNVLNVSIESAKASGGTISIATADGKLVRQEEAVLFRNGKYEKRFWVGDLSSGVYHMVFRVGETVHSEMFFRK